ncbi:iron-containing alcohol dehydrogenase, partial [Candidatus Poribacteria bacterium]|nr:iron-containing alcohol dehydrogenase [Candidatus Poribacteria bacterium]
MDGEIISTNVFGATMDFGFGCLDNLESRAKKFGIRKLLIVTDKGIIKAGIHEKVIQKLESSDIEFFIFDDVQPNPTDDNVMNGIEEYLKNNCDAIMGLGGGSPIDTAKAIRVLAGNPGHIRDYYIPATFNFPLPVLIAIPTTSGTGSEVSTGGIITDTRENRKRVVRSGPASLALIDPELTLGMPPFLTAATGMDALSHNIEAYVSKLYNPFASAIAIAGIKLVSENLRLAVKDGKDINARKNMSMASTMGALAFTKGLGAVHSLAHQLSTDAEVPHGVANAIMLPYVM